MEAILNPRTRTYIIFGMPVSAIVNDTTDQFLLQDVHTDTGIMNASFGITSAFVYQIAHVILVSCCKNFRCKVRNAIYVNRFKVQREISQTFVYAIFCPVGPQKLFGPDV